MRHVEEEYQKRFRDAHSTHGVDAEKLWADIEQNLPSTEPKHRKRVWLWLFFGFAFLGGVWHWFSIQKKHSPESGPWQQTQRMPQPGASLIFEQKNLGTSRSLQKGNLREGEISTKPNYEIQIQPMSTSAAEPSSFTAALLTNTHRRDSASALIITETTIPALPAAASQGLAEETRQAMPARAGLRDYAVLPGAIPPPLTEKTRAIAAPPLIEAPLPETADLRKKSKQKRWEISVLAGAQYCVPRFLPAGNSALYIEALKAVHRAESGYQFVSEIHWNWRPWLRFGTGVGFVSARTAFNFSNSWDTLMYRDNNPDAGLMKARATRRIEHHNRQDFWTLPWSVGVQHTFGRWRAGLDVGLGLNFFQSQSGKSLSFSRKVIGFGAGENTPLPAFFVSAMLQPHLDIEFGGGFRFQFQPLLRFQAHGRSAFYGVKTQSLLWGANLGISREF